MSARRYIPPTPGKDWTFTSFDRVGTHRRRVRYAFKTKERKDGKRAYVRAHGRNGRASECPVAWRAQNICIDDEFPGLRDQIRIYYTYGGLTLSERICT